jgi:hypothetical protein
VNVRANHLYEKGAGGKKQAGSLLEKQAGSLLARPLDQRNRYRAALNR